MPGAPLLGEHADDLEAGRAELDRLTERILAAREEVAEHGLADQDDPAAVGDIRARDAAAGGDRVVLGGEVGGRRADHRCRVARRPVGGRLGRRDDGRDRRDVGRLVGVLDRLHRLAWSGWRSATACPVVAGPRPKRPRLSTVIVFVPSWLILLCTASEEPVPTARRMITAETPISTPSTVSAERSLFALMPCQEIRSVSSRFTRACLRRTRRPLRSCSRRAAERRLTGTLRRSSMISPSRSRTTRLA